jgi:hypothetical protein
MTIGTVEIGRDREVAVITLHRERKLNALSAHMETELFACVAQSSGHIQSGCRRQRRGQSVLGGRGRHRTA